MGRRPDETMYIRPLKLEYVTTMGLCTLSTIPAKPIAHTGIARRRLLARDILDGIQLYALYCQIKH